MKPKKIIITGGATRIGAAIAESLANYDTKISIHYNKSKSAASKLKSKLEKLGSQIYLLKADLNNFNQTQNLLKVANKKIEQISEIINESIDKKKFNNIGVNFKKNKPIRKNQKNKNIVYSKKKIKLGVFYDKSFGFYYSDDIENFKKYGAEIILIN